MVLQGHNELSDISPTDGLATTAGRSSVHIILTHIFNRTKCTTRARAIIFAQDKRNTVCFIASLSWAVSSNNGVCLAVWDLLTPLYICGMGRLSHTIKYIWVATFIQLILDFFSETVQFEMFSLFLYIQCSDVKTWSVLLRKKKHSQQTPHSLPAGVSYGLSIVRCKDRSMFCDSHWFAVLTML